MSAWHDAVYDVLVEECGALDDDQERHSFKLLWPECVEFRFQGRLGFGGKVWHNRRRVYVTCYPEDQIPERLAMIERANERLAAVATEETTT